MRLIIELDSPEEVSFLRRLLSRLNISFVTEEPAQPVSQKAAFEALGELARRGEVARLVPDPMSWQEEMRQDREIPFQD